MFVESNLDGLVFAFDFLPGDGRGLGERAAGEVKGEATFFGEFWGDVVGKANGCDLRPGGERIGAARDAVFSVVA